MVICEQLGLHGQASAKLTQDNLLSSGEKVQGQEREILPDDRNNFTSKLYMYGIQYMGRCSQIATQGCSENSQ